MDPVTQSQEQYLSSPLCSVTHQSGTLQVVETGHWSQTGRQVSLAAQPHLRSEGISPHEGQCGYVTAGYIGCNS